MHARTLYTNTRTRVFAGANWALAALAVLFMMSCAKSSVIEDTPNIDTNGKDPMKFTCLTDDSEQEHNTRADAQPLTTDFMVSTYKAYNTPAQFPVMANYHVEYKTSGTAWDGTMRPYWDYTGVSGQYEKFWDYSAFPYRFHAIAPYPTNPSHSVTLGDVSLSISAPYSYQTVHNGMVTPTDRVAEPYIVAQVQRDPNGRDYDHLATSADNKEINKSSQTRNRYVSLPFHHLNSKVRFGIYSTSPWTTDNPLYIKDMVITVDSPNFATSATGYQANPGSSPYSWYIGTGNSGFTGLTKVTDPTPHTELLRFDGGKEISDNNLTLHQGKSSAYWLQCPDGIMQIPQEGVSMRVSLTLCHMDGREYKAYTDVPIRLEDGTRQYNWRSGYINTYYLILSDIEDKLELTFTATLTPWEDISGSLTTDLEK